MYGKVTKYFHDRKFGFIQGEDDNTYFIHQSKLNGEYVDSGYYVSFKPFQNDRSDYNAKNIMVIVLFGKLDDAFIVILNAAILC